MENVEKINNITDFKSGVIAGFSLAGYKTKDGYILGTLNDKNEDFVKELPKKIKCNNIIYTLEDVYVFDNNFFNANYV
jgi:hypothetical protein